MINEVKAVWPWMGNVVEAVYTVAHGLWVTLRTWIKTYRPDRKTFTEHFEYPELPVPVAARYRGFHRFDLTTCISCDQCAKACPVDCIYIGKERVEGGKGFKITGYTIDYSKCMFCAPTATCEPFTHSTTGARSTAGGQITISFRVRPFTNGRKV